MAIPCSRLATAAIFMIIGVIQLLAGVILLRSKYTDLLSGPDFVAGSSNVAVGCIYGTIASVWKSKKKSAKTTARKNVLAGLLLSVITLNVTAAIVLIMSDGNKLLNLYLENNQQKVVDFASEILAYAYITSVCSPVICIVVALVVFSGRCFEMCRHLNSAKAKNSIANDDSYGWVFDPMANRNLKVVCDATETSSSEDSVFAEEDGSYSRRKSVLSTRNIPSPLHMWTQNQERHSPRKRSNLDPVIENPDFYNCSHKRLIPRIKESSLRRDANPKICNWGKKSSVTVKSILKRSSSSPDSRGMKCYTGDPTNDSVRPQFSTDYDMPYRYGHVLGNDLQSRFCERLGTSSGRNKTDKLGGHRAKDTNNEEALFVDPFLSELKAETLKELKRKVAKILPAVSVNELPKFEEQKVLSVSDSSDENVPMEEAHCSEVSRYKLFTNHSENSFSSGKQLLSDETSDSFHYSSESSHNQCAFKNKSAKTGLSVISKIRSKSFDYVSKEKPFRNQDENKTSSSKRVNENDFSSDSKRTISSKQQDKTFDSSMASIAEIPFEEDYSERHPAFKASDFDENSNIRLKMSPSSRRIHLAKAAKRKSSMAPNHLLKRMWSSSEPRINVADLIVDQDSLIGLSEEELVARTFRIRSLRKTVEERSKKKKPPAANGYSNAL